MEELLYDPINLEKMPVNDFIGNDDNNIVIIYEGKAYGVNKSLFMFNNEMKKCIIENNALLKKTTYDSSETFYNIGFFIGKKIVVNLKTLNTVLKKHKIFELTTRKSGDMYINKELLELTTIGLIKQTDIKARKNFKYAQEEVYFDELVSDVLNEYSLMLYKSLNIFLLNTELYSNNRPLNQEGINILKYQLRVPVGKYVVLKNIDYKNAMNDKINKIDKAFIEAAPRYEKKYIKKFFYRGMDDPYTNTKGNELYNVGETALILNFSSISTSYDEARAFAGPHGIVYKIYLAEGLPYINMISNAELKEEEYLLPRNIIFELIGKTAEEFILLAKPFKPDQFAIKTGCISLDYYDIVPSAIKVKKEPKFIFMDLGEKNYDDNTTDINSYIADLEDKYKVNNTKGQKHFILLVGKPGAGKSYYIKHNLKEKLGTGGTGGTRLDENNFILLNPDDLRYYNNDFVNEISGFLTKDKSSKGENYIVNGKTITCYPNKEGNIVANIHATVNTLEYIHVELQNYILPHFLKSGKNIIYDSTCNDEEHCGNLLNSVKKHGYTVSIVCVDAPTNIAFARAKERQKSDGRFMSDDYLNSIYDNFDIEKKKNAIIKYSKIPVKEFYKIINNNTKSAPKEVIVPPKLKRCPKGTVRDKLTKECVPKNQTMRKTSDKAKHVEVKPKAKLGRCPKGTRRNPKTLLCEPKM